MRHQHKLAIAATILCLGAQPSNSSAMSVDVRAIQIVSTHFGSLDGPKLATLYPGDQITVGVFLSGLEGQVNGTNGLGAFQFSVRTLNDGPGGYAQATASSNGFSAFIPFDFAYSTGTLADSTIASDPDTDLDVIGVSGVQVDGGTPYQPGIGNGQEVQLGTATFTVQPGAGAFDLNTYYNGAGSPIPTLGGLWIKPLINTATNDTNDVSATNLASDSVIGSPVHVAVPEPTSLCLISAAATGLLRRRRNAFSSGGKFFPARAK